MRKKDYVIRAANVALRPFGFRLDYSHKRREKAPPPLRGDVSLAAVARSIGRPLSAVVLGSLDETFDFPENIRSLIKLYSLDAIAPGTSESASSHVVPIQRIVAPMSGPTSFVEREIVGVSSLLQPKPELVSAYGLEWMYRERTTHHGDAVSLDGLRELHGLDRWDIIRTDLEGADHSVIASLGERLRDTSIVEMELRTEPFYVGEPYMHEVCAYMAEKNFEVLDVKIERWRAKTKSMKYETRGRVTFCNTVFVNRDIENRDAERRMRHALAVGLYGYPNFAEKVWSGTGDSMRECASELESLFFGAARGEYHPFPGMEHVTHSASD